MVLWENWTSTAINSANASDLWYVWTTTSGGSTTATTATEARCYIDGPSMDDQIHVQRELERRYRNEREQAEYKRRRIEAERKSLELLRQFLTKEQWDCLEKEGFIVVMGASGAQYEIYDDSYMGNVISVDFGQHVDAGRVSGELKKRGNLARQALCAHPNESLPQGDVMLAQKLALETNDTEFIQKANLA